jgi:hypothetical protein
LFLQAPIKPARPATADSPATIDSSRASRRIKGPIGSSEIVRKSFTANFNTGHASNDIDFDSDFRIFSAELSCLYPAIERPAKKAKMGIA